MDIYKPVSRLIYMHNYWIRINEFLLNDFRTENEADIKGIPDFWLTIFKNVGTLADMMQEHDEPILKHLTDIKVNFLKSSPMVSGNKYASIIG